MVTLLALLYAATQRIRARARTRSRLNNSNRTCAATSQCASTAPSFDWLRGGTRGESAVWAWAGESQCALKRHSAAHARARRCFSFCCQVYKGAVTPQHTPHHPHDLSSVLHGSAIITTQHITHTGNVVVALFVFLLFF